MLFVLLIIVCFAPCATASIDNAVVAKNTSNVVLVLAHVKSMIVVATFGITHAAYDFIIKLRSVLSNGSEYQITYGSLGIERFTSEVWELDNSRTNNRWTTAKHHLLAE